MVFLAEVCAFSINGDSIRIERPHVAGILCFF